MEKSKRSELPVIECHHKAKHNGARQTLAEFVKKILFDCVTCKRYNTRPYNYPKPPDLPKERVSCETPFTEVDYLGPVYCDDEDTHKAFYAVVVFLGSLNTATDFRTRVLRYLRCMHAMWFSF